MNLFLLRHAEAGPGAPDSARPLTERGHLQIELLARRVDTAEFARVSAVEHSPLVRARETATLFRCLSRLPQPLQACEYLKPEDDPNATARRIVQAGRDRLLVGHNPHFELLAGLLLGQGRVTVQVAFRFATCMALEQFSPPTSQVPLGYWQLRWFVGPGTDA
ncbi:MAG: histidine phosphatase family protein [Puniceicoccales bacterium]|jgi:phosphohistidine phosphatase|nr:histidine phosphatase family protein [Puniceicoccales bacterium]